MKTDLTHQWIKQGIIQTLLSLCVFKKMLFGRYCIIYSVKMVILLIKYFIKLFLIFLFAPRLLAQNESICSQFQKADFFIDPYSTSELKGWCKQGGGKNFFSKLYRNCEGGIPQSSVIVFNDSIDVQCDFFGWVSKSIQLNSGPLKIPFLPLLFCKKFTFIILTFHFLTYGLLSPQLL